MFKIRGILQILCSRPKHCFLFNSLEFVGKWISFFNPLEKFFIKKATIEAFFRRRKNIKNLPFHIKHSRFYLSLNRLILHMEKLTLYVIKVIFFSHIELETIFLKKSTLPQTIERRCRCYYNYIWSREQWSHRCKSIHLNFLIDRSFLFDIGSWTRKITFRLIIIKVRNKIMYCIIWEKWLKLSSKLCCQGLIVRDDKCWFLDFLDNICHSKGFSCSCGTKQGNTRFSLIKSSWNLINRLWLISGWLIISF